MCPTGHLHGDHGQAVGIGGMWPVRGAAQRVDYLEKIGERQPESCRLEKQEKRRRDEVHRIPCHDVGDGGRVEQVGDRREQAGREKLSADPAPPAGGDSHEDGGDHCADAKPDLLVAVLTGHKRDRDHQRDQNNPDWQAKPDPCADQPSPERCDRGRKAQGSEKQSCMKEHEKRTCGGREKVRSRPPPG